MNNIHINPNDLGIIYRGFYVLTHVIEFGYNRLVVSLGFLGNVGSRYAE